MNWDFFLKLPDLHKNGLLSFNSVKNVQLLQPLFDSPVPVPVAVKRRI